MEMYGKIFFGRMLLFICVDIYVRDYPGHSGFFFNIWQEHLMAYCIIIECEDKE